MMTLPHFKFNPLKSFCCKLKLNVFDRLFYSLVPSLKKASIHPVKYLHSGRLQTIEHKI